MRVRSPKHILSLQSENPANILGLYLCVGSTNYILNPCHLCDVKIHIYIYIIIYIYAYTYPKKKKYIYIHIYIFIYTSSLILTSMTGDGNQRSTAQCGQLQQRLQRLPGLGRLANCPAAVEAGARAAGTGRGGANCRDLLIFIDILCWFSVWFMP